MCFLPLFLSAAVAFIVVVVPASAVTAHRFTRATMVTPDSRGYSGSWPVTVSHAARGNGTYCLTLVDNGNYGARHSGSASVVMGSQKLQYGTFQVFNHTLVATIQQPGAYYPAGLVFIGSANNGSLGNGVFDQVYGGEAFDEGALAFGMKGGC